MTLPATPTPVNSAPMTAIPEIETERLILRPYRLSDFDTFAACNMDDSRMRWIGGAQSRHGAWQSFAAAMGQWALRGYGVWAVERKDTGALAGRTGVVHAESWPEPELGWVFNAGHEGLGLAHEAALAARDHAARHFGLNPIISQIHPENARSRALAERMGAVVERETTLLGDPCLIYRHPRLDVPAPGREVAA